jgi:hypothetical protein
MATKRDKHIVGRCLTCRKPVELPTSRCFECATGLPRDPRIVALAERRQSRHHQKVYGNLRQEQAS